MIDVLVVDDDFMVAQIHRNYVEQVDDFQVVGMAHTGAQALALAEELQPDLILLDIYLPDVNGLDLLNPLRAVAPAVDVLVISAAREADLVKRALRGGIVQYLMKPFTHDDLQKRLQHYQQTFQVLAETADQTDQEVVDRVFGITRSQASLPKGLSAESLRLVEDRLRLADPDISAGEMAAEVGMSRGSARRYLEHLTDTGKAEVRLRYGEIGRPERRYARR